MSARTIARLLLVAVPLTLAACDKGKETSSDSKSDTEDAGINPSLRDTAIEKAVASAQAGGVGTAQVVDGPPPNGIFGPGLADKAHPKGAPATIDLLDKGRAPLVALGAKALGDDPIGFTMSVNRRTGPQALPNVEYHVKLKKAEGPASAAGTPVVIDVREVKLGAEQPGQLPDAEGIARELGKAKGSTVHATLSSHGGISGLRLTMAEKADQGLIGVLTAFSETLELVFAPVPTEPVGQGAYWMVTDRTTVQGMEMVRYRVLRVTQVTGDEAALTMDLRQYAADASQKPPGIPPNLSFVAFGCQGQGGFTRKAGLLLPTSADLNMPLQIQLSQGTGQQARVMPLQVETRAQLIGKGAAGASSNSAAPTGALPPAPPPAPPPGPKP
jgi:hypothetical protein